MKNEIVHAKCIDISIEGQGIAKSDNLVIFVKEMIPGEEGDIKIISEKKNCAFGIIDKLTVSSPYRIKSDCPISYKCGGCDFRYIDYDYQLVLKKKLLENTFRNLPVKVNDIVKDDNPYRYRNKVQVPVREHEFGFYRKYSNDIVEFEDCTLQSELSNSILLFLKKRLLEKKVDRYFRHILIKHAYGTNEVMVGYIVSDFNIPYINEITDELVRRFPEIKSVLLNLNTRNDNVILGDEEKLLYGRDFIIDEFAGLKVRIALKSFYQTNRAQMVKLYTLVKEKAMISEKDSVLDLYSGIGTISMFLAKYAKKVTGVEIVKEAVANAFENQKMNQLENCEFYLDDAGKNFAKYLNGIDVVIVDPPRKGLTRELIEALIKEKVKKIVYVSCNPATLARDLEMFKEAYAFEEIDAVDMFPYTTHSECVCSLTLK